MWGSVVGEQGKCLGRGLLFATSFCALRTVQSSCPGALLDVSVLEAERAPSPGPASYCRASVDPTQKVLTIQGRF